MFFDTHAHYDDQKFDEDRETLLASLPEQSISLVLNPGCDIETSKIAISLADRFEHVYAGVGIHPSECGGLDLNTTISELENLSNHPKVKAIGEIGLDFYWEENPSPEIQEEFFHAQMALAKKLKLPVIIHDREAHKACLDIVQQYDVSGVYHCYSGGVDHAKILIDRGWMLSFTGVITYKNARKTLEVLDFLPIEHIMLETDSPYLAPVPFRGKRNDSRYLPHIAQVVADCKGISLEECAKITKDNGKRFFHIEK
ncbi:MAG: TatD family hydrolase [Eubacteriales bacterium]